MQFSFDRSRQPHQLKRLLIVLGTYGRASAAGQLRRLRVTISRIGEVELQATEGALVLGLTFAAVSMIRLGNWGGLVAGILIVASLMIHEIGHLAMAQCLGVRVKAIGLCLKGAYVRRSSSPEPLSELLIAASGPAANALLFFWLRDGNAVARWVAMLNLVLAASSLLPVGPSDGQRIASSWRTLRRGRINTNRISTPPL